MLLPLVWSYWSLTPICFSCGQAVGSEDLQQRNQKETQVWSITKP